MPRRLLLLAAASLLLAPLSARLPSAAAEEAVPLIPRQVLFGNPDRAAVRLSPDGTAMSWLAPVEGVMNLWVAPSGDLAAARAVTRDTGRGIGQYQWAFDNRHMLYRQDKGGDENWRVYALDLVTLGVRDLTPLAGVQARLEEASPDFPGDILVGLNDRDKRFHDLYRICIATGARTLVEQNEGFSGFGTDATWKVRFAAKVRPDGGITYLKKGADGAYGPFVDVDHEDAGTTGPMGFTHAGDTLYLRDSRGRDTSALFAMDMATGTAKLLAEDPRADAGGLLTHPVTGDIQAVSFTYERTRWVALDPSIQADLEALGTVDAGEPTIASRTLDDDRWVVAYLRDDGPVRYYLYERATKKATFLFTNRKDLEGLPLVKMHPVVIPSRDGLSLVSLPVAAEERRPRGHRPARRAAAAGARRPRRTLGARRLGLQPAAPVAGQPRLRGAGGELPRLHRLREEVPQWRPTASGPARCTTTCSTPWTGP